MSLIWWLYSQCVDHFREKQKENWLLSSISIKEVQTGETCRGLLYKPEIMHNINLLSAGKELSQVITDSKTFLIVWSQNTMITNPPELMRDRSCSFSARHSHWWAATGSAPASAPVHWNHAIHEFTSTPVNAPNFFSPPSDTDLHLSDTVTGLSDGYPL